MPLEPGQSIGHYRIERLIGEGGMGAVFLALDTKLNRHVALKVLPDVTAGHPDRLARFEREARAVAALNHPHIVTIYSVEEVVEAVSEAPNQHTMVLRLEQPGPGVASLGAYARGGPVMVGMTFYLYGARAAAAVAEHQPA